MTGEVQKQIGLMVTFMEASKNGNTQLAADIIERAKSEGMHITSPLTSKEESRKDDHYSFVKKPGL